MRKLFYNGTILTMDRNNPEAAAVAVEGDRITEVYEEAPSDWREERVDLGGRTLLPGFIDGHSHFVACANALSQCDLSGAHNFHDIVILMKKFLQERRIPKGAWVIGTNYDHNFLEEKRHPDRYVLDKISSEHPVLVIHISNHMGVANSLALCQHQLDASAEDPQGGRYGRFAEDGSLDGYMEENAFMDFRKADTAFDLETMKTNIEEAQKLYARHGITTIQDGMVNEALYQLLKLLAEQGLFKIDVVGYVDLEHCRSLYQERTKEHAYQDHFRLGGYKIFLDGSPQGRTAWMKEPYEGSDDCGYPVHADDDLCRLITEALEDGAQLLAHCNGDAAAEQYVDQFTKVMEEHPDWETHRPVMIHAQLVQKAELRRMKELEMIPSFFVAHTYYWGDIHLQNFGRVRAERVSPVQDAIQAGLRYTFHQDTPVLPPDMMKTIGCAVNRITREGVLLAKEQSVTVQQALEAVTIHAAYQYGEEADKGSIEAGKKANFVILEQNPLSVPVGELEKIRVFQTIADGEAIFCREMENSV